MLKKYQTYYKKNILLAFCLFITNSLLAAPTIYLIPWAGYRVPNKEDSFSFLKDGLAKYGITLKTTGNVKNLPDADFIIVFNQIDEATLHDLKKYPQEKIATFLWEPPVVQEIPYTQKYLSHFSTVFTWNDSFVDNKKYFKFFYHQLSLEMIPNITPFNEKKLLTLVAGNVINNHPQELLSKRREVVQFFEKIDSQEFHVYGGGWQQFKNSKGKIESKTDAIKNYKFYLCYENTKNIQGYISEKIFDAFIAGVVPVYWGADNIADFIPENCFIDGKKLQNPQDLYQFLSCITEQEYNTYIENIRTFLQSPAANKFSCEYFVQNFMEVVQLNGKDRIYKNSTN